MHEILHIFGLCGEPHLTILNLLDLQWLTQYTSTALRIMKKF
jgi:hypothetical protein